MYKIKINDKNDMEKFGSCLAQFLSPGDVVSLIGEMGVGKTTLTQFIGEALGITSFITSPTFSIVQTYPGNIELNHLDLYRIENPQELEYIDIDQYMYPEGISIVEWAIRAPDYMPRNTIDITIKAVDSIQREVNIMGKNVREQMLIEELKKCMY